MIRIFQKSINVNIKLFYFFKIFPEVSILPSIIAHIRSYIHRVGSKQFLLAESNSNSSTLCVKLKIISSTFSHTFVLMTMVFLCFSEEGQRLKESADDDDARAKRTIGSPGGRLDNLKFSITCCLILKGIKIFSKK